MHGSELVLATTAQIRTNDRREIVPTRNKIFLSIVVEIICIKVRNVYFACNQFQFVHKHVIQLYLLLQIGKHQIKVCLWKKINHNTL